jgi:hypothetical protein
MRKMSFSHVPHETGDCGGPLEEAGCVWQTLSGRLAVFQKGVDGGEQGRLLAAGKSLDLLHAAQELRLGLCAGSTATGSET